MMREGDAGNNTTKDKSPSRNINILFSFERKIFRNSLILLNLRLYRYFSPSGVPLATAELPSLPFGSRTRPASGKSRGTETLLNHHGCMFL
jgi:hypothetical protein